jgi:hypothetical protein
MKNLKLYISLLLLFVCSLVLSVWYFRRSPETPNPLVRVIPTPTISIENQLRIIPKTKFSQSLGNIFFSAQLNLNIPDSLPTYKYSSIVWRPSEAGNKIAQRYNLGQTKILDTNEGKLLLWTDGKLTVTASDNKGTLSFSSENVPLIKSDGSTTESVINRLLSDSGMGNIIVYLKPLGDIDSKTADDMGKPQQQTFLEYFVQTPNGYPVYSSLSPVSSLQAIFDSNKNLTSLVINAPFLPTAEISQEKTLTSALIEPALNQGKGSLISSMYRNADKEWTVVSPQFKKVNISSGSVVYFAFGDKQILAPAYLLKGTGISDRGEIQDITYLLPASAE